MAVALYPSDIAFTGTSTIYTADEITLHLNGTIFGFKAGIGTPHQFLRMNAGGTEAAWETVTVATTSAKYILQEADGSLPSAQSLGSLTTGLLKNTVTGSTGVLSTAIAGTDYGTVSAITIGTSGTDFSGSITTNTLTLNLPDASQSDRGVVNTTSQIFGGNKTFDGITTVSPTSSISPDPVFYCEQVDSSGNTKIASFMSPSLSDETNTTWVFGRKDATNECAAYSFNYIASGDVNNYLLTEIRDAGFGVHNTQYTCRFGKTGTGHARGKGRSGIQSIDDHNYPAFEFTSESDETYPYVNLSSNTYPDLHIPVAYQTFSTYNSVITDGINAVAMITGDAEGNNGTSLIGELSFWTNWKGALDKRVTIGSLGQIYAYGITNNGGDGDLTAPAIASSSSYFPTYSNLSNVTSVNTLSGQWYRTGNMVQCYLKCQVVIPIQAAAAAASFEISLPVSSNLVTRDDVIGLTSTNSTTARPDAYINANETTDKARLNTTTVINVAAVTLLYLINYSYEIK